jgi:hypothetical protein
MVADLIAKQVEKRLGEVQASSSGDTPVKPDPKIEAKSKSGYVWENGVLKVIVESFKKTGKTVNAKILFENISDKNIELAYNNNNAHLLDEDGGRWIWKSDTADLYSRRAILAGKKIRAMITFEAKDSVNGRVFDLFLQSDNGHQYIITIQNIKSE